MKEQSHRLAALFLRIVFLSAVLLSPCGITRQVFAQSQESAPFAPENLRVVTDGVSTGFKLSAARIDGRGRQLHLSFKAPADSSWQSPTISAAKLKKLRVVTRSGERLYWLPSQVDAAPTVRVTAAGTAEVTLDVNEWLVHSELPAELSLPSGVIKNETGEVSESVSGFSLQLTNAYQHKHGVRIQSFAGKGEAVGGGTAWLDPHEIAISAPNDVRPLSPGKFGAYAALANGASTGRLRVSDFGFDSQDIPDGASIVGVGLMVFSLHSGAKGDAVTMTLQPVRNGVPIGTPRSGLRMTNTNNDTVGSGGGEIEYGIRGEDRGLHDLWGTSITPADIRNPSFGFDIIATNRSGKAVNVGVLSAQLVVQWSMAPKVIYGGVHIAERNFMAGNWFILHAANSAVGNNRPDQIVYQWEAEVPEAARGQFTVSDPRSGKHTFGKPRDMYKEQSAAYMAMYLPEPGTYTFRCNLIGTAGQVLARGEPIVVTVAPNTRRKIYFGTRGDDANDGLSPQRPKATLEAAVRLAEQSYAKRDVEFVGFDDDVVNFDKVRVDGWKNITFTSTGGGAHGVTLNSLATSGKPWGFDNSEQISFKRVRISSTNSLLLFGYEVKAMSFIDVDTPSRVGSFVESSSSRDGMSTVVLRGTYRFNRYGVGFVNPVLFHFGVTSLSDGDSSANGHLRQAGSRQSSNSRTRRATPQGSKVGGVFYFSQYVPAPGGPSQAVRYHMPWVTYIGNLYRGNVAMYNINPGVFQPRGVHTMRFEANEMRSGHIAFGAARVTIASSVFFGGITKIVKPVEIDIVHSLAFENNASSRHVVENVPSEFGVDNRSIGQIRVVNSAIQKFSDRWSTTVRAGLFQNAESGTQAHLLLGDDQWHEFQSCNFGRRGAKLTPSSPKNAIRLVQGTETGYTYDASDYADPAAASGPFLVDQPWNPNSTATSVSTSDVSADYAWSLAAKDPRLLTQGIPTPGGQIDFARRYRPDTDRVELGPVESVVLP